MKVKANCNLGKLDYPHHPLLDGEEASVPDAIAKVMISRGHAIEIVEDVAVEAAEPEPKPVPVADKPKTSKK